jgi:hypothetical protein
MFWPQNGLRIVSKGIFFNKHLSFGKIFRNIRIKNIDDSGNSSIKMNLKGFPTNSLTSSRERDDCAEGAIRGSQ